MLGCGSLPISSVCTWPLWHYYSLVFLPLQQKLFLERLLLGWPETENQRCYKHPWGDKGCQISSIPTVPIVKADYQCLEGEIACWTDDLKKTFNKHLSGSPKYFLLSPFIHSSFTFMKCMFYKLDVLTFIFQFLAKCPVLEI